MRKEWLARILIVVLLAAAVGIPVLGWWRGSQGVLLHARMAETGGWTLTDYRRFSAIRYAPLGPLV